MVESGFKLRGEAPAFVPRSTSGTVQSSKSNSQRHTRKIVQKTTDYTPQPVVPETVLTPIAQHRGGGVEHIVGLRPPTSQFFNGHALAQGPLGLNDYNQSYINLFLTVLPALYAGDYDAENHTIRFVENTLDSRLRQSIDVLMLRSLLGRFGPNSGSALSFRRWSDIWLHNYFSKAHLSRQEVGRLYNQWRMLGGVEWLLNIVQNDHIALMLPFTLEQVAAAMPYRATGIPLTRYFDLGIKDQQKSGISDHAPIFYPNADMVIWNVTQQAGTIETPEGDRFSSAKFNYPIEETSPDYLARLEVVVHSIESIFIHYPQAQYMLLQEVASPLFNKMDQTEQSGQSAFSRDKLVRTFSQLLNTRNLSILIHNHQAIVWKSGATGWQHAPELIPGSANLRSFAGRVSAFRRSDNALIAVSCHGKFGKAESTLRAMSVVAQEADARSPGCPVVFAGDMNCTAAELVEVGKERGIERWAVFEPNTREATHSSDNNGTAGAGPVDLCCQLVLKQC